ncbi:MAG: hypothetical protein R3E31_03540 [Chloroflexota bacterium]|nr:hypothetical protein [Anaerolineales bacterium]MCA9974833.1 hypothetical protein [Anaerolineales bacterium]MCB8968979.1 hypothetical protein [Ardenticatenaceae bacterium]
MAKQKKRREVTSKGPTQPKFKPKQHRTFSEQAFIVVGILIALSMVLSLFVINR